MPPGQRGMALAAYARSVPRSARWAAAVRAMNVTRVPSESRFMSLRINRPIPPFNPRFEPALHVHHVAEARDAEQFGGERAVGGRRSVYEHGLVLVRQKLRQLALDGVQRRVER